MSLDTCVSCDRPRYAREWCKLHYYAAGGPGYASVLRYRRSDKGRATTRRRASTPEARARHSAFARRRMYGLTPEQYDALLAVQQGACAICGNACSTGRRLSVDHDHREGCDWRTRASRGNRCNCPIRGLLCQRCNAALGVIERGDDGAVTPERVRYLRERSA